ncbi:hypothetical protein [Pontibacter litorisediminis]|uniref:hypothetical protein n=1 Tax=Pontibacter litorisediminis TaxID=1846260 RepID=UPI0023EA943A|nr:hypothetical protein [Pontibacter litorisediminis]
MKSKKPSFKQLKFNRPQLRFIVSKIASAISLWGRATGKSSLIAWLIHLIVQTMPRSKWVLVGSTYKQILAVTLPSTIASLERIGYIKDKHYFVGRKPPAKYRWPLPYEPPLDDQYAIYFYTGACIQLVTQDANGSSARGNNLDGIICDESLLLNKERFDKEVSAGNRGNRRYFGKNPLHHGVFHFSSMPYGDQGRWLIEAGDYILDKYDLLSLQKEITDLQLKFIDSRDRDFRKRAWADMQEISKLIRFTPDEKGLLYSEANAFDNIVNLGLKYLEQQRLELTDFVFLTEVLNRRPGTVEEGFYPMLDMKRHALDRNNNDYLIGLDFNLRKLQQKNCLMDSDCVATEPIRGAVDWGSKISVLSTAQHLPGEYRFLKGLYVKHPKLINDLADQFIEYYEPHLKKEFFFIQDSEWGNARRPDSDMTYNEQFAERLRKAGWSVKIVNMGRVPPHQTRYHLAHEFLGEKDSRLPAIRFNKDNCKDILTAMSLAPVKQGRDGQIMKDKSSEKKLTVPGQEATHFTDTVDLHFLSIDKHILHIQPDFSDFMLMSA